MFHYYIFLSDGIFSQLAGTIEMTLIFHLEKQYELSDSFNVADWGNINFQNGSWDTYYMVPLCYHFPWQPRRSKLAKCVSRRRAHATSLEMPIWCLVTLLTADIKHIRVFAITYSELLVSIFTKAIVETVWMWMKFSIQAAAILFFMKATMFVCIYGGSQQTNNRKCFIRLGLRRYSHRHSFQ